MEISTPCELKNDTLNQTLSCFEDINRQLRQIGGNTMINGKSTKFCMVIRESAEGETG